MNPLNENYMKKTLFICLLSCLLFAPCYAQNRKKNEKQPDKKTATAPSTKLTKDDFHSGRIDLNEAAKDISQLLNHDTLHTLANYSLGGMFCIDDFYRPAEPLAVDTIRGTLMWYCLNRTGQFPQYPPFFLGLEPMNKDYVNENLKPERFLIRPTNPHVYTSTITDWHTIRRYLIDSQQTLNCDAIPTVFFPDTATQRGFIREFRAYIKTIPRVTANNASYNLKDWAYFQNNYDSTVNEGALTHLVKQTGAKYIRYYFGYDKGKTGKNSIRVILFAVKADGRALTNYIVQKSIPPAKRKDITP